MFNQPTQTDSQPRDTDEPIACEILQGCGPAAVEDYHQSGPYSIGDIHSVDLPEPVNDVSV